MSDLFTQLQIEYEPTTTYFEICKNVVKPAIKEEVQLVIHAGC